MRLKYLVFSFYIILASCSTFQNTHLELNEFKPWVDSFQEEHDKFGGYLIVTNLIIRKTRLFGSMVGFCDYEAPTPTITIDATFWDNSDTIIQELLIFHELGHCIINRVHKTTMNQDLMPESIMYPYITEFQGQVNELYYESHRNSYMKELFTDE